MKKTTLRKLAASLAVCALAALPSFASARSHHTDALYDRYAAQNPTSVPADSVASTYDNTRIHAVIVGSEKDYLNRAELFLAIIDDEMNDKDHHHTPVIADAKIHAQWIEYCKSMFRTGEHILKDDDLTNYAGKCGTPVLFVYPTEDIKYSEKKKYDDGRLKTEYIATQRFVIILADKDRIINKHEITAVGDSTQSRDRALVDAFEEGVDRAEEMLFKWR